MGKVAPKCDWVLTGRPDTKMIGVLIDCTETFTIPICFGWARDELVIATPLRS